MLCSSVLLLCWMLLYHSHNRNLMSLLKKQLCLQWKPARNCLLQVSRMQVIKRKMLNMRWTASSRWECRCEGQFWKCIKIVKQTKKGKTNFSQVQNSLFCDFFFLGKMVQIQHEVSINCGWWRTMLFSKQKIHIIRNPQLSWREAAVCSL